MTRTVDTALANPSFTAGDTGWERYGTGWRIVVGQAHLSSDDGASDGPAELLNSHIMASYPGQVINATGNVSGGGADNNMAAVFIEWLDASKTRIAKDQGNTSDPKSRNVRETSKVTGTAPAGTAYVSLGVWGNCVANGGTDCIGVTWDYVQDRTASLISPATGDVYTVGDSIKFQVQIGGTIPPVTSVTYKKDGVNAAFTTSPDYSYNVTNLTVGTHVITADVLFTSGQVITTNAATVTVQAEAIVPITREFKASNSYTYLVGSNFSALANAMPLTSLVTGVQLLIDYNLQTLTRSKDLGITDPLGSNPNIVFDITNDGTMEAIMLENNAGTYSALGTSITTPIPIIRSDFDLEEEGLSEGKKWTVLNSHPASVTMGTDKALFGQSPIAAAAFLERVIGIRFYPNMLSKPTYADSGDACIRMLLNKLRLRVYFDAGSAKYYFASPNKAQVIEGELVSASLYSGDYKVADAKGVLQLNPILVIKDGTQTFIGNDWTIHAAYPPTTANQIGNVANQDNLHTTNGVIDDPRLVVGMVYNGLPPQESIISNRSRYEFITANFFADKKLDSIYGVHGLPRAFAYNGNFFYKIVTQSDPIKDSPRHVAYNQGHLALGYDEGRTDISVIGQPYNFDGALGASSWSTGDKVVGLLPLTGTILGIFCAKSIWGLSGTTVDNFSTQVVAPNMGAIEYTVTDMGFPVYANAYGVYTLAQTQQYGDYLGTPMSQDVSPWLRPRLVRKYTSDQEVAVAWPVRSKNQYRLAFSDGYVMSMTLNSGMQSQPTFSKQKYFIVPPGTSPPEGSFYDYKAMVPIAISSQLDQTGEERIHMADIPDVIPPPPVINLAGEKEMAVLHGGSSSPAYFVMDTDFYISDTSIPSCTVGTIASASFVSGKAYAYGNAIPTDEYPAHCAIYKDMTSVAITEQHTITTATVSLDIGIGKFVVTLLEAISWEMALVDCMFIITDSLGDTYLTRIQATGL